jgi:hypothetical protein
MNKSGIIYNNYICFKTFAFDKKGKVNVYMNKNILF